MSAPLRSSLFSSTELAFYEALKQASPNYLIAPKVRLWDVFEVSSRDPLANKIRSKHVDFVLCDSQGHFVMAIELDDRSHRREDRQRRDEFVNDLFKQAQLPLLRFETQRHYSAQQIAQVLAQHLSSPR
jgi:hypothetical protein